MFFVPCRTGQIQDNARAGPLSPPIKSGAAGSAFGPPHLAGSRRIPGDFEAKIALLTCLGNGKSPRHRQQAIEARD